MIVVSSPSSVKRHSIKLTDIEIKRRFYLVTHGKRTLPGLYAAFMEHVLAGSDNPGIA